MPWYREADHGAISYYGSVIREELEFPIFVINLRTQKPVALVAA